MDACRLNVKNRKVLENYYYLALKPAALKESNVLSGQITNGFRKDVSRYGKKMLPSSYVNQQLLSVKVQDSIHDCLERIYTRNGGSYDNPKLIGKALSHGLTPEAIALISKEKGRLVVNQTESVLTLGRNGKGKKQRKRSTKAASSQSHSEAEVGTNIMLKGSAFNAPDKKGADEDRTLNESFIVKREDVDDLIYLSSAGGVNRQVLIIYGINHHTYFSMVGNYIRALLPFTLTYFTGISPDLVPSITSWYHRKMYVSPYQYSILSATTIPTGALSTIIIDRNISGVEMKSLKDKYPNAYIAEMGCSRLILSLNYDQHGLSWIIPTSIPIKEAKSLIGTNGEQLKDMLFRNSFLEYDPTYQYYSNAVTLLRHYTLANVNPIRHPLRGSIDKGRVDEILERIINHRDGIYKGVVSFGIIADKGVGKTTFSHILQDMLLKCGVLLSVIDSDDYGRWLYYLFNKYGPLEDIAESVLITELDNPSIRDNKGPISYYNVIMTNLAIKYSLNSFQKVDLLRNETNLHPIFEDFKANVLVFFGKGFYSIQKYYEYVIQRCESRVILIESHTTLENVRALPSDLFVRLSTVFCGDITIKSSRAKMTDTPSTHYLLAEGRSVDNMVHIGEYLLYYYYKRYTVRDVVAVTPAYFLHSDKLISTQVIVPPTTAIQGHDITNTSIPTRGESEPAEVTDSTPGQRV